MSTLLITASTSVRASQSGLPVSRAIRSANGSIFLRTMLAKRRSVSTRKASGLAAHPGQPWRASETSASGSPTAPVHKAVPVAGSIEVRVSDIVLSCP
jgi:hypothetical protein